MSRFVAALDALVFGVWTGLLLIPRLPVTLVRVVRALNASLSGVSNDELLAFGRHDIGFRPWYGKIARDQHRFGRSGYVWDDGFGLGMGWRFYANYVTYALYRALGVRRYAALSIVLFLATMFAGTFVRSSDPILAAAITLLIAGSPLFIAIQIHYGKPEMLWWFSLPLIMLAWWEGQYALAGVIVTLAAICNFAATLLIGATAVLFALLFWPGWAGFAWFAAACVPGVLKSVIRVLPYLRTLGAGKFVKEQTDAVGPHALRNFIRPGAIVYLFFFVSSLAILDFSTGAGGKFMIVALILVLFYVLGQSVILLNDAQSFWMWHLSLLVGCFFFAPSWLGAGALILFAFMRPPGLGPAIAQSAADQGRFSLARLNASGSPRRVLLQFPFISPVSRRWVVAPFAEFFAAVPDGHRVLFETQSHHRTFGGYRAFLNMSDEYLPQRGVELLPDEWVRITTLNFYRAELTHLNASSPAADVARVSEMTGASHVVAFTEEFSARLADGSYEMVGTLDPATIDASLREMLELPANTLRLYRSPRSSGHIAPAVDARRSAQSIKWEAKSGTTYVVRYRYDRDFQAVQGGTALPVMPQMAAPETDLHFMAVTALSDGPITLSFRA